MNQLTRHRSYLVASALLGGIVPWLVPAARAEDPRWIKLNGLPQASVGLEVEGSSETIRTGGGQSVYDTLFITPTVGLRTSGSIYHPNLVAFDLDGELGWGWDSMTTRSSGSSQTRNESQELTRYLAQINFLEAKPYNASVFAAQDHTFRDYGTFETFTVDSERYGGRVNWNTDHLSLNAELGYRDETATGFKDSTEISETYFNFVGINRRHFGQTTLNLHINQFDNILNFGNRQNSQNESISLSDSETFGSRKQITAATGVGYSQSEYSGQQTETVNADENVLMNHRPNLDSYLMLDFAHNHLRQVTDTIGGGVPIQQVTDQADQRVQGVYGLRHQLYESLASNLDAHGSHQESSGSASLATSDRYGLGLYENYNKRLRSWGRLSVGAGLVADHQEENSSGSTLVSIEAHQLYLPTSPQYRPVYLDRPRVLTSSIRVNVAGDVLAATTDYQVVSSGELTEIRLVVPTSSHLQSLLQTNDNLTISVTYESDSANNAAYESLNATFQVRLDLYNHLGIYGRLNWMDNNAPPAVLAQTLTDLVGGVDYNWRWLRTGAEYEDYDSSYTQYQALRFFQNFDFHLDSRSSLSFNFNETFYNYPGNRDQTQYQFLSRYNAQLWSSLSWYVEGGCTLMEIVDSDQTQGSARTGLNWTRGKLSVRAGYEYNTLSTSSGPYTEEREKHRLFAYLKRTF